VQVGNAALHSDGLDGEGGIAQEIASSLHALVPDGFADGLALVPAKKTQQMTVGNSGLAKNAFYCEIFGQAQIDDLECLQKRGMNRFFARGGMASAESQSTSQSRTLARAGRRLNPQTKNASKSSFLASFNVPR